MKFYLFLQIYHQRFIKYYPKLHKQIFIHLKKKSLHLKPQETIKGTAIIQHFQVITISMTTLLTLKLI